MEPIMMTREERLMHWLRDAHAMEEQAEQMMRATADRLKDYPELRLKVVEHLEDTRRQAIAVRGCIERRGGKISVVKDMAARTTAIAQGLGGLFFTNEVVKALQALYTFEHMEIAAYSILIATAEHVGDDRTKAVCETILAEEKAMAAWVYEHLLEMTHEYLSRSTPKAA
jgi:ferritin-like metal-binding protein YciE